VKLSMTWRLRAAIVAFRRTDCNYVFLNEIPTVGNDVEDVQDICGRLFILCAARCCLLLSVL
jgi:hypothetical protein